MREHCTETEQQNKQSHVDNHRHLRVDHPLSYHGQSNAEAPLQSREAGVHAAELGEILVQEPCEIRNTVLGGDQVLVA